MFEAPLIYTILTGAFTGGIAFGGFKVALNGTKKRIERLEEMGHRVEIERVLAHERLASVETKLDMIYDKVK